MGYAETDQKFTSCRELASPCPSAADCALPLVVEVQNLLVDSVVVDIPVCNSVYMRAVPSWEVLTIYSISCFIYETFHLSKYNL